MNTCTPYGIVVRVNYSVANNEESKLSNIYILYIVMIMQVETLIKSKNSLLNVLGT